MIVVHGGLLAGRFMLWGETPFSETKTPLKPRGRKPKTPRSPSFPGDAGKDALQAILNDAFPYEANETAAAAETACVWLPTIAGTPLPSSPLIAEPPESTEPAVLAAWAVTVLPLSPAQTIDFLGACLDRPTLAHGVIVGATLAFWAAALRLGGALTAREQFLPDLEQTDGKWRACWSPVWTGAEGRRRDRLAQVMPGACRALSDSAAKAPDRPAAVVLSDFVGIMIDALVRLAAMGTAVVVPGRRPAKQKPTFDSLHDQWLHALRSADGAMRGSDADLHSFAEQVRSWRRPMTVAAAAPFRLCFRLEEPVATQSEEAVVTSRGIWTIRYLLQAQDDPSLLIPAADAWIAKGRQAALLQRGGFPLREYLLAALGQAASLCREVEASLTTAAPADFITDAAGAHRFLSETAGALDQAGFGLFLPAWWTGKGTRQRLAVRAQARSQSTEGGGGLSLDQLVQFDWVVALGEHTLTLRELEMLAKLKAPLVQIRGQWVHINAEEIQAAIDFWKNQQASEGTVRDLVRMALGASPAPGGLEFQGVTATGWVGDFLNQLEGKASFTELPAPAGFQGTLRPYQLRGYSWLAFLRRWGLGACLADDMGLGKTIQTLALIQHDWENNGRRPTLLICPTSVVGNWKKEAERFTPDLPVLIHHGQERARTGAFAAAAKKHALVLSSYGLLHRDLAFFQKPSWAGVILDEAQNIKNPATKQAQAARSLNGDYRIALTGTPVENHVGDLWSIWQFLNPGFLPNQAEFRRMFFIPIQFQRDAGAAERLKRLTGPFLLRRLKTDKTVISDLPSKLETKVFCNLTREQASLYAAVVEDLNRRLKDSEGVQRRGQILAALSKLKQVCNHPAQFLKDNSPIPGRSGKLARLTEMIDELLQAGDRALIFTQFTEMGEIIRRHLQETFGAETLFLHGATSRKQRDRMVARFQEEADGPRLFLLSLKAGGTGLNLTAANHVFHFDRWWNPAVENQATDRAFRIGQKRNVQVHKFLCVGTLEEKIDEMIERKKEVAAQVVGAGEAWLTELSNEDLKEVFALRQEALGE